MRQKINKALEGYQRNYYFFVLGATVVSWRVNNQEQLFVR